MKVFCFGVGNAGGAIADALWGYEETLQADFLVDAVVCDIATANFDQLAHIPTANQIRFGAATIDDGEATDATQIADLAEANHRQLVRGTDGAPVSKADAFLVCAGLGGNTGGGAAPVLAKHLQRIYQQPVYGVGVLPATRAGPQQAHTAVQALRRFVSVTDHVLAFDNETWLSDGTTDKNYDSINADLAQRLGTLFAAGEVHSDSVGESVVDASEIINTLHGGGVATLGYASSELPEEQNDSGWFGLKRFFGSPQPTDVDPIESQERITTQTREALLGRLTLPCDVQSASRGLVVVGGPPAWLNRDAIEQSRAWVEEQTDSRAIRGGDYPQPDSSQVEVLTLLGGVSPAKRLEALRSVAEADSAESTT